MKKDAITVLEPDKTDPGTTASLQKSIENIIRIVKGKKPYFLSIRRAIF